MEVDLEKNGEGKSRYMNEYMNGIWRKSNGFCGDDENDDDGQAIRRFWREIA